MKKDAKIVNVSDKEEFVVNYDRIKDSEESDRFGKQVWVSLLGDSSHPVRRLANTIAMIASLVCSPITTLILLVTAAKPGKILALILIIIFPIQLPRLYSFFVSNINDENMSLSLFGTWYAFLFGAFLSAMYFFANEAKEHVKPQKGVLMLNIKGTPLVRGKQVVARSKLFTSALFATSALKITLVHYICKTDNLDFFGIVRFYTQLGEFWYLSLILTFQVHWWLDYLLELHLYNKKLLSELDYKHNDREAINYFHIDTLMAWNKDRRRLIKKVATFFYMGIFGHLILHWLLCASVLIIHEFKLILPEGKYFFQKDSFFIVCLVDVALLFAVNVRSFQVALKMNTSHVETVDRLLDMKSDLHELVDVIEHKKHPLKTAVKKQINKDKIEETEKFDLVTTFNLALWKMRASSETELDEKEYIDRIRRTLDLMMERISFDGVNNQIKLFGFLPLNSAILKTSLVSIISLAFASLKKYLKFNQLSILY
eukprot:TRINITY_DN14195_c0_g1_i3.p1 TRINITY_DN14195_c0_g1~~TRINITY_DN14195_c0_g1_i3.p1  ORF type:complete len:485 (-),score=64.55 TRINITY_DN14195_c0_g1_i3:86-1540(-)